ncbi:hypothetical protein FQA47_005819 [Oryzias melastigma]|uniref:Uncharacterized protein n=1 Tax=Oryzias melastigma TaxID=30732 RepID=A0A834FQU8_ORYME|nr:hypothetical protein FQA47_005819 [Oryzias melastigma]
MNDRAEEVEIYIWWRIKTKRCNEETEWTQGNTHREKEGVCQLQKTDILHFEHTRTHTLLHMTIYIRERREEGGTAQRELALPRTDAHLTHCTGSQSAFHCTLLAARTSLCLIVKKK